MKNKNLVFILLPATTFFVKAQDISTIKNTQEIYSTNINTGSARYTAMAGSMGALGGELASINTNPAGLGVYITGDIQATLSINNNTNSASNSNLMYEYKTNKSSLGQAGGVMVIPINESDWKFVNIGLNYSYSNIENYIQTPQNTSFTLQRELENQSGTIATGTFTNTAHAYNRTGNSAKINVGIGANYNNNIYIGGSLNFHSIDIEQYDTQRFNLDLDGKTYDFNKLYTPFAEDASGFSFALGAIAKLNQNFRLGLSIESPTWWSIDRAFTEQYINNNNNIVSTVYNEDRTLTSPMKMTISGAFVMSKSLAINIDYGLGLTKPKYKVQGIAETELNDFFKQEYKNMSDLRIGAEYRNGIFRLRGGYGYQSKPFSDNILIGDKHTLSTGIGFDFKTFYIDASYQNINSKYTDHYGGGSYFSDQISLYSNETYTSNIKNKQNNFFITLGWKF